MADAEYNWYKLDNAAKLFPAVSTGTATNVFRFTIRMTETVLPSALEEAVIAALDDTPSFKVRLRKGLFWYYFEYNPNAPKVEEESEYPCRKFEKTTNGSYLFRTTYYGKFINVEFFHALCDGTGALAFLTKIITHYLLIVHSELSLPDVWCEGISGFAQTEDSFARMTQKSDIKPQNVLRARAYNISATLTQEGEIRVYKGIMSVNQVKAFAKSRGATITEAMAGLLIYSLYKEGFVYSPVDRPIDICIPVNLRKFFPSETMRNFFTTVGIGVNFCKQAYTLDEVIAQVHESMRRELDMELLYPKILYCVEAQRNIFLRFVPLFLKNIALRMTYSKGERGFSSVISNVGEFKLPKELEGFVERFELLLSPTLQSRYKCGLSSCGDTLVFTFTTNAENAEIPRRFYTTLAKNGVDVTISSNVKETKVKK